MTMAATAPAPTTDNRAKLLLDLILTAAAFEGFRYLFAALHTWQPTLLAVAASVAFATWRLWASKSSWREIGIRTPKHWWTIPLWVVLAYVGVALVVSLGVAPLARALNWPPVDLSRFSFVRGNPTGLATMLAVSWSTAAFGEEMLFRGFAMTRIEKILGGGVFAIIVAILLQTALFGLGHLYLGNRGVANAMAVGLVYGIVYYLSGRNMWALMIAHGLTDSISMLALYFGRMG